MRTPFDTVRRFEREIAEYTGARYATAVDCCSHAIYLSAIYHKKLYGTTQVSLPRHTYVSVPMQLRHAGYSIEFDDRMWSGWYEIINTNIWDSAVRLTSGMYMPGTLTCLSFQFHKILSTIKGGMIIYDDDDFRHWITPRTHDGRNMDIPYNDDRITCLGYHMFMTPETAQMGLDNLSRLPLHNPDMAGYQTYPDVSYTNGLD